MGNERPLRVNTESSWISKNLDRREKYRLPALKCPELSNYKTKPSYLITELGLSEDMTFLFMPSFPVLPLTL